MKHLRSQLTACKDCSRCETIGVTNLCSAQLERNRYFNAFDGEYAYHRIECSVLNTNGNCQYFKARE